MLIPLLGSYIDKSDDILYTFAMIPQLWEHLSHKGMVQFKTTYVPWNNNIY